MEERALVGKANVNSFEVVCDRCLRAGRHDKCWRSQREADKHRCGFSGAHLDRNS